MRARSGAEDREGKGQESRTMSELEIVWDFASPNSYFVHRVLPGILERTGASLRYRICLLGGLFRESGNTEPMVKYAATPNRLKYEQLELQRFVARHGLTKFHWNPHFPLRTVTAMRAALLVEPSRLPAFIEAGMAAAWEEGRNISEAEVLRAVLDEAGFDGAALVEGAGAPEVKARLIENTAQAVKDGVFGVPTFFVGDRMFWGKERLGQVEEALRQG